MKRSLFVVALVGLLACAAVVYAQDPKQKLLAKRAAELDAYRKLAEQIKGFHIDSQTTVKDFVTENDEIHTAFRHFIKGAEAVGKPRYFEDGTCEVDMRITLERVVTEIEKIVKRYYTGTGHKDVEFKDIKKYVETNEVLVTGSGVPRTDEQYPAKLREEYISSRKTSPWSEDPLWSKIPARVRLKVKTAAKVLAQRNLAEFIKGFQITAESKVSDFMLDSDEVTTKLSAYLKNVIISKYTYRPDGVIEAEAEVTLERVVTELETIKKRYYRGNRYKDVVFEDVKKYTERKVVKAIGEAPLPDQYLTPVSKPDPVNEQKPEEKAPIVVEEVPEWAKGKLTVTAEGLPPEDVDSEAEAELKAERAATERAKAMLAEKLQGVKITSETTVKDFMLESDKIKTEVEGFVTGFKTVESKQLEDGVTWQVTLELDLKEFYKIYKKYSKK